MTMIKNPDIQVRSLSFVVDRPPNPEWHLTDNMNTDFFVLAYAKSGNAFYTFGDEKINIRKGNIIFVKQNQLYSARSDPGCPWHFVSAAFSLDFQDDISQTVLQEMPNSFSFSDSSHMAQDFAELYRIWTAKEAGYLIKCRSLILDILYLLLGDNCRSRRANAHDRKFEEIIDMMRENIRESYTLDQLSVLSGLSSSHFRALFKERTGMTAVQFQNHLKIDRAKDLILSRDCNVTEAAYAVGFNDVYYFSRMFRKLTGKNPSEYLH